MVLGIKGLICSTQEVAYFYTDTFSNFNCKSSKPYYHMKTFTSFCLAALCFLGAQSLKAQATALYSNPAAPCAGPTASVLVGLVNPVPLAVTYSWSVIGGSSTLNPIAPTFSTVDGFFTAGIYTITVFPFTMSGTTPVLIAGAVTSMTLNVGSGPTTSIVASSTAFCVGNTVTLTAFGATNYVWSNSVAGQSVVVSPTSSMCFSVAGSTSGSCGAINSICLNVLPLPTLNVVPGTTTVCNGSSETFTASGASSYTWNNTANTSTFNILQTAAYAQHTLVGTNSFGCSFSYTFSITLDSTCAHVWPGDANSDGVVGLTDVLEVGLQATSTGPARTPGGNAYTSQYATAWTGSVSTGKNKCHADCNGDGTVNIADTVAISNNFSLTHAFKPAAAGDQITLVPVQTQAQIGKWNVINVLLGSTASQVQSHGVAFEISFDNTKIVPDSIWIEFVNSAFTAGNQFIPFRKKDFVNGKLYVALTRAGGADVSVGGVIAKIHYKVGAQVAAGTQINFGVSAGEKMLANGLSSSVSGDSQSISTTDNLTSISKLNSELALAVYPNPAHDIVLVKGKDAEAYTLILMDLSGRVLIDKQFSSQTTINIAALDNGIYLFEVSTANGVQSQRITVMH